MSNLRNIYFILFSLYWAQGLPVGFMTHALPVILRSQGVSLAHIGGFGLLMLPWSVKIFWAPLVDRYGSSSVGHYRSWIIPSQILTIFMLIALSFIPVDSLNQPTYLLSFFVVLLLMNTLGATQDIATDGLAVNVLKASQQHWGNTFQVVGSRLGFIVGGGAILWSLDWLQWQNTFLCLAVLVALNTLPIFFTKEPVYAFKMEEVDHKKNSHTFISSIRHYLTYFTSSKELKFWLMVLVSFKIADGLSGPILKPLMVDLGLSFSEIGIYITMLGALAALVGAALAGLSLKYISRTKALIMFSVLKLFTLIAYTWLVFQYDAKYVVASWIIYLINAAEDMVSSMLLVVMLTLVMQYCRKKMAGTDFTCQVALMATISGGLYAISGFFADFLGYVKYLCIINIVMCITILPIVKWAQNYKNTS